MLKEINVKCRINTQNKESRNKFISAIDGKKGCLLRKINISEVVRASSLHRNASTVIVFFGIVLLCFIWIDLYYKVQNERQLEIDSAFKETVILARAFEEHALRTIKSADQTAMFLKYEYEREGLNNTSSFHINEMKLVSQPFLSLSVIDENGALVDSSEVPIVFSNVKEQEYFLIHKNIDSEELFISKPVMERTSGKGFIQMSRRVNKPDGSFGGVAVVGIDPLYFTEFYKRVNLGGKSSITLLGRDGTIRARESGQQASFGGEISQTLLVENLVVSAVGHITLVSPVDGVKRIYNYRSLKGYPLLLLVGLDEAGVLERANKQIVSYCLVVGMISILIIIFVIMLLLVIARQNRAQEALKQARDGLEVRVEERTQELMQKNTQLIAALKEIELAQVQLIQQEKLAGIGQLAAGVAHEINNPLGFITGNIEVLEQYFTSFNIILAQYRELRSNIVAIGDCQIAEKVNQVIRFEQEQDLEYILEDLPNLFRDTNEGLNRMSKIVKGIGVFSRVEQKQVFELYDLNKRLENTLLVANNEIKHYAIVEEEFGNIPMVEAIIGEIDQVLLNLLINAVQAIKERDSGKVGMIRIRTWCDKEVVCCSIEDDGVGVSAENMHQIFNPFFTTKPVGLGTGMGLSISYEIIVNHHHGEVVVENCPEGGAKFIIKLPVKQDSHGKDRSKSV